MVKIKELFNIKYGNSLSLQDCELSSNGVPFVSRGTKNNGVVARVKLLNNIKLGAVLDNLNLLKFKYETQ